MNMNFYNLRKLANFLLSLPEDYRHFDMETYYYNPDQSDSSEVGEMLAASHLLNSPCGTIACALGHGPAAGIPVHDFDEEWIDYCERAFGVNYIPWDEHTNMSEHVLAVTADPMIDPYEYMFGGHWADVDNTPHGAARRILAVCDRFEPKADISMFESVREMEFA